MRFFIYFGFMLWLAATLIFKFWGDVLVDPSRPFIWFSFILIAPGILLFLHWLFRDRNISPADRPKAALLIAIPGMLLDLFSITFHSVVFPDIPGAYLHLFFVWLMWAYSLILLGGLFRQSQV